MEQPRYRAAVVGALPWMAAFIGVALATVAGLSLWHGGRTAAEVGVLVVAGVNVLLALRWMRRPPRLRQAYPFAVALFGMALALLMLRLMVGRDPQATVGVILLVVAVASVLLDPVWSIVTTVLIWNGFIASVLVVGDVPGGWSQWFLGLAAATLLGAALNRSRRGSTDALDLAVAEARAAAVTDALTGVANRLGLQLLAAPMMETARRAGDAVHCLFMDVDGFKRINDECGHASGDEVLVAVADALTAVTRATDVVARWGGDEFVIVGPGAGMAPLDLERRVAEHLRRAPAVPEEVWDSRITVGAAQEPPWEHEPLEHLVDAADQAMYRRRALLRRAAALDATEPAVDGGTV